MKKKAKPNLKKQKKVSQKIHKKRRKQKREQDYNWYNDDNLHNLPSLVHML